MTEPNGKDAAKEDALLTDLEDVVKKIITGKKVSMENKLAAINAGVRLLAIRHKINGGPQDEGFFGK